MPENMLFSLISGRTFLILRAKCMVATLLYLGEAQKVCAANALPLTAEVTGSIPGLVFISE